MDVPLLRESRVYVERLSRAAKKFNDSRYLLAKRINWSCLYANEYHEQETRAFRYDPTRYLEDGSDTEPFLEDVFKKPVSLQSVAKITLKVLAHTGYRAIGFFWLRNVPTPMIFRKAYVEDIERAFSSQQSDVIRVVFPFPLGLGRQIRYLIYLRRQGHRFCLYGNAYGLLDLLKFIKERDIRALARLEGRAQLRLAKEITSVGFREIQLSDEFNIGSLDFSRMASRRSVTIVNSAHGVGKYLPIHKYSKFLHLTRRQKAFYTALGPCKYQIRRLPMSNLEYRKEALAGSVGGERHRRAETEIKRLKVVLMSQITDGGMPEYIHQEKKLHRRLAEALNSDPRIALYFYKHPNSRSHKKPHGFKDARELSYPVNHTNTLLISMCSTTHIDPDFTGRKVLVRDELIFPEIVFDEDSEIIDTDCLTDFILDMVSIRH